MFYDYNQVLSYNALLNFIIGERGVGKTYGAKKFVINRFLKTGEQFVYIRRYKTELKESVGDEKDEKFFQQVKSIFPDHKFKVSGEKLMIDNKICGYALSLSTANILKSTSFEKVKTLIFDEFIIDKGCYHYLRNEVEQFLDLIETISRLRDTRVLLLGNAISITNPYFTYFNLSIPYNSTVKLYKNGLILVNYIKNIEYREVKKQSRFGKLIEGTQYSKYAIDNEFLRDSKSFIKKHKNTAKFYFTIRYDKHDYGVWYDYQNDEIFISYKYDPKCPIIFTVTSDDHKEGSVLIRKRSSDFFKSVIEHYRLGKLCFENQQIKNSIMDLINTSLTY